MNIPPKVRDDELRDFFNTYVVTADASKGIFNDQRPRRLS